MKNAFKLKALVLISLKIGFIIAAIILEEVLAERAHNHINMPICPICGSPLNSKGWLSRTMITLIGIINWERKIWRCPNKCKIGQVAPFDEELGLKANQRVGEELKQLACLLAIFVPFEIASSLLKALTGVEVSPAAIWNWVQEAGKETIRRLQIELGSLKDKIPAVEELVQQLTMLPLLIGGDGVMVAFRPNKGSPKGKIAWREVKVGIFVRLGERVTKTGKNVSIFVRRKLVAVLGNIEELTIRMWLTSIKEGILISPKVVWISDGGRGFWRLFSDKFSKYAQGILDFYHAAQNIWKGASACFDGRTQKANQWFSQARHLLRLGRANEVLNEIKEILRSKDLPRSVRNTLENLVNYLEGHTDHINYAHYKELGLPIGSGMVESACKWLIQQRFKCVGMRWSEDGFNHLLHLRLAWVNGSYNDLF